MTKKLSLIFLILIMFLVGGCSLEPTDNNSSDVSSKTSDSLIEDGEYTSWEDVALYLDTYNKLPPNFITKKQAEALGWESKEGNLWDVAPGKSIGGDHFSNRENKLPKSDGRKYYECDIDYEGGYRGEKRLIYSNDGLMFYTEDHYENFDEIVFE